jgi:hypothetical protein
MSLSRSTVSHWTADSDISGIFIGRHHRVSCYWLLLCKVVRVVVGEDRRRCAQLRLSEEKSTVRVSN